MYKNMMGLLRAKHTLNYMIIYCWLKARFPIFIIQDTTLKKDLDIYLPEGPKDRWLITGLFYFLLSP